MNPASWPPNDPEIHAALEAAWADGSWGRYDGPHNDRLAAALAEMHGVDHVLACSSGTFAVELALRGLGIGENDEVILAGYDFPGNFRSIEAVGARPVLCDIRPATWCLDVEKIGVAVSPKTKAIIVSHLHGGLAPMRTICELALRLQLSVVEDACQATGAKVDGRMTGSWGDVGVLSFGGSKVLTAGRGGAVMTRRADVFQRAKIFCDRGNNAFPLSELQAAVLVPQLPKLAERNARRLENVRRLLALTRTIGALAPVELASDSAGTNASTNKPSFYKLGWLWDAVAAGGRSREDFLAAVQRAGVAMDAGFRGFTGRSGNRCRKPMPLPFSETAAAATVILHHPVLLESAETIEQLAKILREIVSK